MTQELFSPDNDPEQHAANLSVQWFNHHSLALLTLSSVSQSTIDQFVNTWHHIENEWPAEGPIRLIFDLSSREMSLTPYFRPKLEKMIDHFAQQPGLRLFVMSPVIITQSMQMFFANSFRHKKIDERTDVVFSHQAAFEWFNKMNAGA
jgi:hypothetical protein